MTVQDQYRVKATELYARAWREKHPTVRREFEKLALGFLKLAAQAERYRSAFDGVRKDQSARGD